MNQSVTELSEFPKTVPFKTADGIIQGVGVTKSSSRAWDAQKGKIVDIPAGTIIALGGSMGIRRILGTDVFVTCHTIYPFGPKLCFKGYSRIR